MLKQVKRIKNKKSHQDINELQMTLKKVNYNDNLPSKKKKKK